MNKSEFSDKLSAILNKAKAVGAKDIVIGLLPDQTAQLSFVGENEFLGVLKYDLSGYEYHLLTTSLADESLVKRVDSDGLCYLTQFKATGKVVKGGSENIYISNLLVVNSNSGIGSDVLIRVVGYQNENLPMKDISISDYDVAGAVSFLDEFCSYF